MTTYYTNNEDSSVAKVTTFPDGSTGTIIIPHNYIEGAISFLNPQKGSEDYERLAQEFRDMKQRRLNRGAPVEPLDRPPLFVDQDPVIIEHD